MVAYARPSLGEDVNELAPNLRVEDVAEIKAASGKTPWKALYDGYSLSKVCLSIIHQSKVIGMFGVVPCSEPNVGIVWLLASPELPLITRGFVRQTPEYLAKFHQEFPLLMNLVDERNEVHVRWLRRIGFTIINRHPHAGAEQRSFLEFVRISNNV